MEPLTKQIAINIDFHNPNLVLQIQSKVSCHLVAVTQEKTSPQLKDC